MSKTKCLIPHPPPLELDFWLRSFHISHPPLARTSLPPPQPSSKKSLPCQVHQLPHGCIPHCTCRKNCLIQIILSVDWFTFAQKYPCSQQPSWTYPPCLQWLPISLSFSQYHICHPWTWSSPCTPRSIAQTPQVCTTPGPSGRCASPGIKGMVSVG